MVGVRCRSLLLVWEFPEAAPDGRFHRFSSTSLDFVHLSAGCQSSAGCFGGISAKQVGTTDCMEPAATLGQSYVALYVRASADKKLKRNPRSG